MLRLKLAAFVLLLGTSFAQATIIAISTDPAIGRVAVNASAQTLPDGSQFLIGTFATPGNISLLSSVAAIQAAGGWSQFDGARAIATVGPFPGKLTGQATDNTATADPFNNQSLYIMVFNTSSAATATQVGIFRAPAATVPWTFPTNLGGVGDTRTIDVDSTNVAVVGGVGTVNNTPGTLRFGLVALVPEPTSVALLVPGVLGLLGYRRLRRNR